MPTPPTDRSPTLAICGGGNGGHVLAVVASAHFAGDILWLTSTEEKAARLRKGLFAPEGLQATGVVSGSAHRVRGISADPAEVIPHADLVLLALPAFAHAPVLGRIAPHLKDDVTLGAMPSRSGLEFDLAPILAGPGCSRRTAFGLQTLPWTARVQAIGRIVEVKGIKASVPSAARPADRAVPMTWDLTRLFGTEILRLSSFLDLTLGNPGQVIHPAGMYGLFGDRERIYRKRDIPQFYLDLPDRAAAVMEAISQEIITLVPFDPGSQRGDAQSSRRAADLRVGATILSDANRRHQQPRRLPPNQRGVPRHYGADARGGARRVCPRLSPPLPGRRRAQ